MSFGPRIPSLTPVSFATALLLGATEARAADSDAQIAQTLFDEARVLLDAGRYAEACPKLAESQRLDPGGGTLLNLALCHEREGKTATAWLEFREALAQAERDRRDDRISFAREHIASLEPNLVKVSIVVPESIAKSAVEIQLDTSRVPRAAWRTALPVDPGEHRVAAKSGDATWTTTVSLLEPGRTHEVVVGTPAARLEPAAPTVRRRSTAFWVALSGAGALAVTSAVTGIVALNADNYAKDHCSSERHFCPTADAEDAKARARTFAWISTGTLGGAVAAAAVAFILPFDTRSGVSAAFLVDDRQAIGVLRFSGM